MPSAVNAHIPAQNIETVLPLLEKAHKSFLSKAVGTVGGGTTPFLKYHSPGIVKYLRKSVSHEISEPSYVAKNVLLESNVEFGKEGKDFTDQFPLNTILFGPPGTGKTYTVQRKAVEIIDPSAANLPDGEIGEKFRGYRDEGRIEFVTFHPSFSYEEFVEGFRYDPSARVPTLHDGIFKEICGAADGVDEVSSESGGRVWKVSLGGRGEHRVFERCMENGEIAVGWLHGIDLTGAEGGRIAELFREHHPGSNFRSTNRLVNEMHEGDYVAVYDSPTAIRALGVVTGGYEFKDGYEDGYHHVRPVRWLDREVRDIHALNGNTRLTMETVYNLWRIPPSKLAALLSDTPESDTDKPYVLIIDEINRGNISRIFGELITLLETDKRRGAENELSVKLPYSQKDFAVPGNLHVVGTMNTADRSIALLDVALRRRFEFEEMMPDAGVIRKVLTKKEAETDIIDLICSVFEVLNARITALLDRDHQIGHSYFLGATSPDGLHHTLYRRAFPLLQEYFYNDPAQMRRLLGEYHSDDGGSGFIEKPKMNFGNGDFSFDAEADDAPWTFHEYDAEELEDALRRTFLE